MLKVFLIVASMDVFCFSPIDLEFLCECLTSQRISAESSHALYDRQGFVHRNAFLELPQACNQEIP